MRRRAVVYVYGKRWYGKVDEVPGLGHVATWFFHAQYLPIIPLGCYLVVDDEVCPDAGGLPIPVSLKSILVAWFRAAVAIGAFLFLCVAIADKAWVANGLGIAAMAGLYAASRLVPGVGRASYERALEIADALELDRCGRIQLELMYGRIGEREAERALREEEERAAARQRAERGRAAAVNDAWEEQRRAASDRVRDREAMRERAWAKRRAETRRAGRDGGGRAWSSVDCPCGREVRVHADWSGSGVRCPRCGERVATG